MRTTGGIIGIAAAVLLVSFLLPENRRFVPSLSFTQASDVTGPPARSEAKSTPAGGAPALRVFRTDENDLERQTRSKLASVIPAIEIPESIPFQEALKILADRGGVQLHVRWAQLAQSGIDQNEAISGMKLKNVRLETALRLLLDQVTVPSANKSENPTRGGTPMPIPGQPPGGRMGFAVSATPPPVGLYYGVLDSAVVISTTPDWDQPELRIYDVRDLIHPPLTEAQHLAVQASVEQRMIPGRPIPQGPADQVLSEALRQLRESDQIQFTNLIGGLIQRDGQSVNLSVYDGLLVANVPVSAHDKITEAIKLLREAKAARPSEPSTQPAALSWNPGR